MVGRLVELRSFRLALKTTQLITDRQRDGYIQKERKEEWRKRNKMKRRERKERKYRCIFHWHIFYL